MPDAGSEAVRMVSYQLEIEIGASRERTWRALTDEIDQWWLPDFHMVGEGSVVSLEARAGGQLLERLEGGGSLLWYTVQMCTPGEALHLVGSIAPDWGGPTTSMLKLALEDHDGGCVLHVSDALFGRVSDETVSSLQQGWAQLFREGLKAYVERDAGL